MNIDCNFPTLVVNCSKFPYPFQINTGYVGHAIKFLKIQHYHRILKAKVTI